MTQDLTAVLDQLSAHEAKLALELNELSSKAKSVHEKLTQVRTALSALNGVPTERAPAISKKPKKNTADHATVELIVRDLLREKTSLPQTVLFDRVKAQLLSKGISRVGLKAIFSRVVSSPAIAVDGSNNVSIKRNTQATSGASPTTASA